jgi:BirA family biotin operon repressor/biotin-[acetyl-CoA-carboxylase] ligase
MRVSTRLKIDKIQEGLHTKKLGRTIIFLHETDSTNNVAKELAAYGAEEGTVVVAEIQTAGRGRLDREWISPTGGLWFSVVLRPKLSMAKAFRLVFAAGLAVTRALHEKYGLPIETKWPNDVLVRGKKICGILVETNSTERELNFAVLGVGVNADFDVKNALPNALTEAATSLKNELGHKVDLNELLGMILECIENVYGSLVNGRWSHILGEWKEFAVFLDHRVEIVCGNERVSGVALDVDLDGTLIVRLDDGAVKRVTSGDVSLSVSAEP